MLSCLSEPTTPMGAHPSITAAPTVIVSTPFQTFDTGRIAFLRSSFVYLAKADGTSPALIHAFEIPVPMFSLSPDGKKIAYFHDNYLYVKDIPSGVVNTWNAEKMGSIGGKLLWSPNGEKIAFACSTPEMPFNSICLVERNGKVEYVMTKENIEGEQIRPDYFVELQDWSRDGQTLVLLYYSPTGKGEKQDFRVYFYDLVSASLQLVFDSTKQRTVFQVRDVRVSPDKDKLLISGLNNNFLYRVFVVKIEDNEIIPLELDGWPNASYTDPVWSDEACCYYVHVQQANSQRTLLVDLSGKVLLSLEIEGIVFQFISGKNTHRP